MSLYAFMFGIITFFSTLSGGLFVIKYQKLFGVVSAISGGVLLAVSFFDLLPETLRLAPNSGIPFEYIMYSMLAGFFFLLVIERFFSVRRVYISGKYQNVRRGRGGWFGTGEIAVHSFIEGVAIGLSFGLDFQFGIVVAVAVIAHDFCDGINAVTVMINSNNTVKSSAQMLILVAIAPLLGVSSTLFVTIPESYLVLVIPLLVGGFIYLATNDCLPDAYEKNPPWATISFSLVGVFIIFAIVRILNI